MKTLKQEEINGSSYCNLRQARSAIAAFIETVYNGQRPHSALAYRSPDEYEAAFRQIFRGDVIACKVSVTEICYQFPVSPRGRIPKL
jgi:hypothetical protein